jgi:membrane protein YqaA with SNARE-associated domain
MANPVWLKQDQEQAVPESWIIDYGVTGLFLASFLAATILPFSSEAALALALGTGMDKTTALIAASTGNCLACLFNYGMGFFIRGKAGARLAASRSGRKAIEWMEKYGLVSLLLSWAPVIGDPITIAAGVGKVNLMWFVLIVFTLRIGRYLVIAGFF